MLKEIVISLGLFWVSMALIFAAWGTYPHKTISDHVAVSSPRAVYLFATFIFLGMHTYAMVVWLLPIIGASGQVYGMVVASYVVHVLTALVPRTKRKIWLHDMLAVAFGLSLLTTVALMSGLWVSDMIRVVLQVIAACMVVFGLLILNRSRRFYMVYQLLFFMLFSCGVLALSVSASYQ